MATLSVYCGIVGSMFVCVKQLVRACAFLLTEKTFWAGFIPPRRTVVKRRNFSTSLVVLNLLLMMLPLIGHILRTSLRGKVFSRSRLFIKIIIKGIDRLNKNHRWKNNVERKAKFASLAKDAVSSIDQHDPCR